MKMTSRLAVVAMLAAGAAFAAEATDPTVKAWQEAMGGGAGHAKTLGEMAKGAMAYDAAAAEAAKAALVAEAAAIPDLFRTQASDPKSKAKAEIWANYADFEAKAKALGDAAAALDTSSPETIGAGMAGVGGACKACHETYRSS